MNKNDFNYYWIQKTDYSTEEFPVSSKQQAINGFLNYDWKKELQKYDESNGNLNCPAGYGLHNGNKDGSSFTTLLHICPIDEKQAFFNLHYNVEYKLFSIFKFKANKIMYKDKISFGDAAKVIELLYDSNIEATLKFLEKATGNTSS